MSNLNYSLLIIIGMAFPSILVGYLIAVKQKRGLIAGWNESKCTNAKVYAQLLGYSLLIFGVLTVLITASLYYGLIDQIGWSIAMGLASLVPLVCVIIANYKYIKHGR